MTQHSLPQPAPTARRRRVWPHRVVVAVLLLAGAVVSAWPVGAAVVHDREAATITSVYREQVARTAPKALDSEIKKARAYNATLDPSILYDPWGEGGGPSTTPEHAAYMKQLDRYKSMGRITVPRIKVDQPIYHDASEVPLARGVGHLFGSSLPVGGKGTNAVLAGHTGMRARTVFDRLPELKQGDTFTVEVYGVTMEYKVSEIRVVEPDDLDAVKPVEGEDLVTLVTCYDPPVGHRMRMLVTGTRQPDAASAAPAERTTTVTTVLPLEPGDVQQWMKPRLGIAGATLALLALMALSWIIGDRRDAARRTAQPVPRRLMTENAR